MGSMLARDALRAGYEVLVYDPNPSLGDLRDIELADLKTLAKSADVIIISTPLQVVKEILLEIRDLVRKRSLVLDIASIKRGLEDVYKKYPDGVYVASAHPMFGYGAGTFKGYKVLVLPVNGREEGAVKAKAFFELLGSKVYIVDWKEHEEMIKYTIGLPYFISVAFLLTISPQKEKAVLYGGTSYTYLSTYAQAMFVDDPSFIQELIQYSIEAISEFLEKAHAFLSAEDKKGILEKIQSFIDSEDAYRLFYKALKIMIKDNQNIYFT
ncbi:MAG: hypothetical protein DRJ37_07340 [Thermoprotei archaeon]|nr:MAG: hypothetical protein DRJ37_07340 [Thermoprotei archaeon]